VRLLHNKSQQGDNGGQYSPEETVNRWLAEPRPSGSPAAMGEVIKGEYEKWRRIVQAAKIEKE
jgi:hypothetical protein